MSGDGTFTLDVGSKGIVTNGDAPATGRDAHARLKAVRPTTPTDLHGRREATDNERVAEALEEVAALLEAQEANPFRVRAYRRGADRVRHLEVDVGGLLAREGRKGLEALRDVGAGLAGVISELLDTGRLGLLDRLRGAFAPEDLFASLPGLGPELASRIHQELGIDTLEELELASWDGRLRELQGFGPRRVEALRALLDSRLSRSRRRRARLLGEAHIGGRFDPPGSDHRPPVHMLLSVDDEYRRRSLERTLPLIAPRRFNRQGSAWLPVLHTRRGPWDLHALFSNSAVAHRLGRTRDWIVIYYERDGDEGQATVVTERRGPLQGQRVVRGREEEGESYREPDTDRTRRVGS